MILMVIFICLILYKTLGLSQVLVRVAVDTPGQNAIMGRTQMIPHNTRLVPKSYPMIMPSPDTGLSIR
ncbi:MAG: hypothetical protein A2V45_06495 [Candidatus Aminicenantes bacterium RBG_19FT_COMBO_58_17]|nr:MAG: hypothetical protein A2V45_06495 [Candidatus Aminicenantes bacterium RBG_19FT_COMBO_58_17]